MSQAKSVNGYLIKQATDGQWWIASQAGEDVAGPFSAQDTAIEVAAVLQDQPAAAPRRSSNRP